MITGNKRAVAGFLWLCLGLLLPWDTMAQEEDPFAAEKARIREIKLSGDYYYSDVASGDADDASAMALKLLALEIQAQETGCEQIAGLLQDSCRYVRLKRIDRPRVFAYIAKETVAVWLDGGSAQPVQVQTGEVRPAEIDPPGDTSAATDSLGPVARTDTPDVPLQADTTAIRLVADSLATGKDTTVVKTEVKPVVVADTSVVTIKDTVTTIVADTLRVVIRDTVSMTVTDTVRTRLELRTTGNDRLDRILRMKTIAEVQPFFIAEKKAGRMMFGKMASASRPEECYLLFFDREGNIVAVLGKGTRTRLNLLTGKADSADRYREGNGAIWFLLYE